MERLSNNRGLTLIEIIVTLAVLGVVVTPLMNMFIASQKINNESNEEYKTLQLAQKYMENIKSAEYIDDIVNELHYTPNGINTYRTPDPNEDLPYEVAIKIIPNPAGTPVSNGPGEDENLPVVTIYDSSVKWETDSEVKTLSIENAEVDITVGGTEITVAGEGHPVMGSDMEVRLETSEAVEARMNFINSTDSGKVYLTDNGREWSFDVFGGKAPDIVSVEELPADEILYDIEIEIYKSGQQVNRLESTNIFK